MLTTREVAEKLDANPGTIRMWCINGTFPNARQEETARGPVWLIPETDLHGFERRGPGRPSRKQAQTDLDERATKDLEGATSAKPKPKASKRSPAKKASKTTRSKKPMKKGTAKK